MIRALSNEPSCNEMYSFFVSVTHTSYTIICIETFFAAAIDKTCFEKTEASVTQYSATIYIQDMFMTIYR